MGKIVVFLQNAWSPFYAGIEWPRANWLHALADSRSGQRLRLLIDDPEYCWNTTPITGATPSSKEPPDEDYVRGILKEQKPVLVIACGKQAEKALTKLWSGSLLAIPHPAARVLTDALYVQARAMIESGWTGRVALRQRRGMVEHKRIA